MLRQRPNWCGYWYGAYRQAIDGIPSLILPNLHSVVLMRTRRLLSLSRPYCGVLNTGAAVLILLIFGAAIPSAALAQRGTRIERMREQLLKDKEEQEKQADDDRAGRLPPRENPATPALSGWLDRLEALTPKRAAGFSTADIAEFRKAIDATEGWAAELIRFDSTTRPSEVLQAVAGLLDAKSRCDRLLDQTLATRTGMAPLASDSRRAAILNFLTTTSALIDLSGRLRYMAFDALSVAADEVADAPALREQLLDELIRRRSNIGAAVSVDLLYDPAADETEKAVPVSIATKRKVLELIALTGQRDLVGHVARFARNPRTPPSLLLTAAETLRQIGMPQDVRPGQDPKAPPPAITPKELYELLTKTPAQFWQPNERKRLAELTAWLTGRMKSGLAEDRLRMGSFDVQPGDWLLMRNPSPYNLFTDYSPGLFTHVGVATIEKGPDGIRRMVLVDLPERGSSMPATNIDAFVDRTLHYILLRHPDPEAAQDGGNSRHTDRRPDRVRPQLPHRSRDGAERSAAGWEENSYLLRGLAAALQPRFGTPERGILSDSRSAGWRIHAREPGEDWHHIWR